MITFSAAYTWLGSAVVFSLCPLMLFLVFRRKLYRRIKFFTAYLILFLIWAVVVGWVSPTPFFNSLAWRYIYYGVEYFLSFLRLLTIAEISMRFFRGYPAIKSLATWLMAAVATGLILWTAYSAVFNYHHVRRFILVTDLRLECTQAVLILTLIVIGVYYRIPLPPLYQFILIGIGVYSSVQVANNALGLHEPVLPNSFFDYIRRGSAMVSLGIWTYAILRSSGVPDPEPSLISQSTYDRMAPEVHERLKELNEKLTELVTKNRK
jgi:hypothetical protein